MLFMLCRSQDFYDFDYANETGQLLQFLRLEEGDVELPARQVAPTSLPEVRNATAHSTVNHGYMRPRLAVFTMPTFHF